MMSATCTKTNARMHARRKAGVRPNELNQLMVS